MTSLQSKMDREDKSIKKMSNDYGSYAASQRLGCNYLHQNYIKKIMTEKLTKLFSRGSIQNETNIIRTINLVDYGAADARNSLDIYEDMILNVASYNQSDNKNCGKNRKVNLLIGIQDLPSNNWDLVKENIQNNLASKYDPILYEKLSKFKSDTSLSELKEFTGTDIAIKLCPSSFYNTVSLAMPKDSVDIAFTSIATHWLSPSVIRKYDLKLSNSIIANSKLSTSFEMQQFMNASMEDGVEFLKARGMEMRSGGKLLMCNATRLTPEEAKAFLNKAEPNDNLDKTKFLDDTSIFSTYYAVFEDITSLLKDWSQRPGIEISFPCIPAFSKSPKEWEKCFAHPDVIKTGLVLERGETRIFENPYFTKAMERRKNDACPSSAESIKKNKDFANEYMKSIMAWGHGLFMKAFNGKAELEHEFCEELKEKYFSRHPERYRYDFVMYFCEAAKL